MGFDKKEQRLIMLTAHYPYGNGEPFIDDELKSASQYFNEIVIFSLNKGKTEKIRSLPNNVRVVLCRNKRFELLKLFAVALKMMTPKTFKESHFACKKLGFSNKGMILKRIFISYYIGKLIERAFKKERLPAENDIYYSYWLSSEAVFLSELKKKHPYLKCIGRAHGGDCFIERGYQPFRREVLTYLDEIHSISEAGLESIRKNLIPHTTVSCDKVKVSRLGINKHEEILTPYFGSCERFCVVTCSNVIQLKRLDLMIEALSKIDDLKIEWIHFGSGALEGQIKEFAEKMLGNKENITYRFAGYVEKNKILEYYGNHHVDLFVNCSDSEGIPVSIMEAMSYGIPVIARNVGGNSEIVNNINGILLPTEASSDMLCHAIQKTFKMTETEIAVMKRSAFNTFLHEYNAKSNYEQFWSKIINE